MSSSCLFLHSYVSFCRRYPRLNFRPPSKPGPVIPSSLNPAPGAPFLPPRYCPDSTLLSGPSFMVAPTSPDRSKCSPSPCSSPCQTYLCQYTLQYPMLRVRAWTQTDDAYPLLPSSLRQGARISVTAVDEEGLPLLKFGVVEKRMGEWAWRTWVAWYRLALHCARVTVPLLSCFINHQAHTIPGLSVRVVVRHRSESDAHLFFPASVRYRRTWWMIHGLRECNVDNEGDVAHLDGASGPGEHGFADTHHVPNGQVTPPPSFAHLSWGNFFPSGVQRIASATTASLRMRAAKNREVGSWSNVASLLQVS